MLICPKCRLCVHGRGAAPDVAAGGVPIHVLAETVAAVSELLPEYVPMATCAAFLKEHEGHDVRGLLVGASGARFWSHVRLHPSGAGLLWQGALSV